MILNPTSELPKELRGAFDAGSFICAACIEHDPVQLKRYQATVEGQTDEMIAAMAYDDWWSHEICRVCGGGVSP